MDSRAPAVLLAVVLSIACGSSTPPAVTAPPLAFEASIALSDEPSAPASVEATAEFRLTFSEPLDGSTVPGAVRLEVDRPGGLWIDDPPVDSTWNAASPSEVVVRTRDGLALPRGHAYRLSVGTGIRAASGQSLAAARVGYFATDVVSTLGAGGLIGSPGDRSVIYVVSDVHMGDERAVDDKGPYPPFGWLVDHRVGLRKFLEVAAVTDDLKELVIAGDLFDEWVAPMDLSAFGDAPSESAFFDSIVRANAEVVAAFNALAALPGVQVTYVPGNHDMLVQEEDVSRHFPGFHQARDGKRPGRYSPAGHDEVVIEHGHRYDFFNAPDPLSNLDVTGGGSILPPGYFVSKVASTSDRERHRPPGVAGPLAGQGATASALSLPEYTLYGTAWLAVLAGRPIDPMDLTRTVATGIDGFTRSYPIRDLVPYPSGDGLDVTLYKHIESNWPARQAANGVPRPISAAVAIVNSAVGAGIDLQATWQYFLDPLSNKRIVIFGHTHDVRVLETRNHAGQGAIYANSGTWIDHHDRDTTMTYLTIAPPHEDSTVTTVTAWRFVPDGEPIQLGSAAITAR